jgi:hypothetical protein
MTAPAERVEELAADLLGRTRAETAQADNKAAILLAGVLAMTGSGWAVLSSSSWNPLSQGSLVTVFFWASLASVLGAVGCLAGALYPRQRSGRAAPGFVGYFEDVVALGSVVELKQSLRRPELDLLDVWADQIWQLCRIVQRKYSLIRWAIRFIGSAVVLGAGSVASYIWA